MSYDYRRLTTREKEEIVEHRRKRGFPLHAPPHPYRGQGCYLITAANFTHQHIMKSSERRTEFELLLLEMLAGIDTMPVCWVVLPNHYHFMVNLKSLDRLSSGIQHLHGSTSRLWNQEDLMTGKRKVWYRYRDTYIRSEAQFFKAMNYIHFNPVKHQYIKSPYNWPWSSIHDYFDSHGRDWLREMWKNHLPGSDFGSGWDD